LSNFARFGKPEIDLAAGCTKRGYFISLRGPIQMIDKLATDIHENWETRTISTKSFGKMYFRNIIRIFFFRKTVDRIYDVITSRNVDKLSVLFIITDQRLLIKQSIQAVRVKRFVFTMKIRFRRSRLGNLPVERRTDSDERPPIRSVLLGGNDDNRNIRRNRYVCSPLVIRDRRVIRYAVEYARPNEFPLSFVARGNINYT